MALAGAPHGGVVRLGMAPVIFHRAVGLHNLSQGWAVLGVVSLLMLRGVEGTGVVGGGFVGGDGGDGAQ